MMGSKSLSSYGGNSIIGVLHWYHNDIQQLKVNELSRVLIYVPFYLKVLNIFVGAGIDSWVCMR